MVIENSWKLQSLNEKLTLREDELHIWRTKVSKNEYNLDFYWNLLSQDEQVRAKEFYFVRDRNCYIIARGILRSLIASYADIAPKNILFKYTEYGKPYLAVNNDFSEIKFNLAHSKDSIVYAFTKNIDVGIDIEFINKDFVMEDVVNYCCSKQEQHSLQKLLRF
jgi:4'-phosphopantetheinyl transferase